MLIDFLLVMLLISPTDLWTHAWNVFGFIFRQLPTTCFFAANISVITFMIYTLKAVEKGDTKMATMAQNDSYFGRPSSLLQSYLEFMLSKSCLFEVILLYFCKYLGLPIENCHLILNISESYLLKIIREVDAVLIVLVLIKLIKSRVKQSAIDLQNAFGPSEIKASLLWGNSLLFYLLLR